MSLALDVTSFSTLPEPGGVRDQVVGELGRIRYAMNVYNTFRSWQLARDKGKWIEQNREMNEIRNFIEGLRRGKSRI